ncbi:putative cyclic nucleotide-gated ion channel 3 isoform X2 [Silene latifolia]|uniref:putative cyclic nucleotide-gated ion channel 3 isoform X2 n=1 Tax=Silene latifolia TaxID=37657 RepID=UPI003D78855C
MELNHGRRRISRRRRRWLSSLTSLYPAKFPNDGDYFQLEGVNTNGTSLSTFRCCHITDAITFICCLRCTRYVSDGKVYILTEESRRFGRGEIVEKLKSIATRYLKSYFIVDVLAVLPLPQILVLIPRLGWPRSTSKDLLTLVIFIQYLPRFFRVYPLYKEVMRTSGVVTGRSWAGAALNLLLYVLASHVIGAVWYLFSIDRLNTCWHESCIGHGCLHLHTSIYCNYNRVNDYTFNKTYCSHVDSDQVKSSMVFDFGMFCEALQSEVVQSRKFFKKISLCFWWGLRSLSSYGQNFQASNYVGENLFATFICISGLLLFSFLFGNIQKYLNSATAKVEEMKSKWHDTEKWMSHRSLTDDLKKRIRKYELCKWQETRGVNEDTVLSELPRDLRVDIKRHLWNKCFYHILNVPWFEGLNDEMLDEMCDWLKPIIYMEKSLIMRQGHPIKKVFFIMRGQLSIKSAGGATLGPVNPGDYCGLELLTWAANPDNSNSSVLPKADSTMETLTVVEAFTLKSDELRSVMKHLHVLRPKLQHELKFYSQQSRLQAAYHIQAAWRQHSKRKPTL